MKRHEPTTVLINPRSGATHHRNAVSGLQHLLSTHLPWAAIQVLDPAVYPTEAAHAAMASGARVVVAAGGDGTVSAVAQALVGTPITLGVLPFGTLNHFAQAVGVSQHLPLAVAQLAMSPVRCVDVGAVNDYVFVNNASIGLYPELVRLRTQRGATLAHPVRLLGAFRQLLRMGQPVPLTLQYGNHRSYQRVWLLFVGNNHYRLGPLHPGARSRLDGGCLDVALVRAEDWRDVLTLLTATGHRHTQIQPLMRLASDAITVEPASMAASIVACDGETVELRPPLMFRSVPQSLRVFSPPSSGSVSGKPC